MKNELLNYLFLLNNSTSNLKAELEGMVTPELYQPRQIILAAGHIEQRLWFLEQGVLRSFYYDEGGRDHTVDFYIPADLYFSYQGYWQEPSEVYLEALQPTECNTISYQDVARLQSKYPEFSAQIKLVIREQRRREQFKNRLLTLSAEERFQQYRAARPQVFRHVSIRHIASYLNMTRENLSRLMNRR